MKSTPRDGKHRVLVAFTLVVTAGLGFGLWTAMRPTDRPRGEVEAPNGRAARAAQRAEAAASREVVLETPVDPEAPHGPGAARPVPAAASLVPTGPQTAALDTSGATPGPLAGEPVAATTKPANASKPGGKKRKAEKPRDFTETPLPRQAKVKNRSLPDKVKKRASAKGQAKKGKKKPGGRR